MDPNTIFINLLSLVVTITRWGVHPKYLVRQFQCLSTIRVEYETRHSSSTLFGSNVDSRRFDCPRHCISSGTLSGARFPASRIPVDRIWLWVVKSPYTPLSTQGGL